MVIKIFYKTVLIALALVASFGIYLASFGMTVSSYYLQENIFKNLGLMKDLDTNLENSSVRISLNGLNLIADIDSFNIYLPGKTGEFKLKKVNFAFNITEIIKGSFKPQFQSLDSVEVNYRQENEEVTPKTSSSQLYELLDTLISTSQNENFLMFLKSNLNFSVREIKVGDTLIEDLSLSKAESLIEPGKYKFVGKASFGEIKYDFSLGINQDKAVNLDLFYNFKFGFSRNKTKLYEESSDIVFIENIDVNGTLYKNAPPKFSGKIFISSNNGDLIKMTGGGSDAKSLSEVLNVSFNFSSFGKNNQIVISDINLTSPESKIRVKGSLNIELKEDRLKTVTNFDKVMFSSRDDLVREVDLRRLPNLMTSVSLGSNLKVINVFDVSLFNENFLIPLVGKSSVRISNKRVNCDINLSFDEILFSKLSDLFPELIELYFSEFLAEKSNINMKLNGKIHLVVADGVIKTFKNDLIFSNLDFISSEGQEIFKGVSGSAKILSNRIYIKLDQIITNDRFFPINERSSADLDKLSEFATLLRESEVYIEYTQEGLRAVSFRGNLSGNLGPVLRFVDEIPSFDLQAKDILDKASETNGNINFYLSNKINEEGEIELDKLNLSGSIKSAKVESFIGDDDVSISNVNFEYTDKFFVFEGKAELSDGVFLFNFVQTKDPSQGKALNITGNLGKRLFSKIMDPFSSTDLVGNLPINAKFIFKKDNTKFQIMSNTEQSLLSFNDIDYVKPHGKKGKLSIDGIKSDKSLKYTLRFFTPEVEINSDFRFMEDSLKIKFSEFKIADIIDVKGSVETDFDEHNVNIIGSNLNYYRLKKLLKRKFFDKRINFLIDVKKLNLTKKNFLTDVTGVVTLKDAMAGSLDGKLNGYQEIVIDFTKPRDKKTKFYATSDNAGNVFRALNAYQNGFGGDFNFDGVLKENGGFSGKMSAKDVQVLNGPILAQIISLASLYGLLDLLSGKGIVFDDIEGIIDTDPSRTIVKKGVAVGKSLGITMDGTFTKDPNFSDETIINANGVLSPFFNINNAVKMLPFIGGLLGGDKGEGAFGVQYRLEGSRKKPTVLINPLSILTPGKFRDVLISE